jgi:hypothetical protein
VGVDTREVIDIKTPCVPLSVRKNIIRNINKITESDSNSSSKNTMDLFDFEIEPAEMDLYSTSLDSTQSFELQEAQTPLLYESKISSRNNSIATVEECFIDQLDISQDVRSLPEPVSSKNHFNYNTTIICSLEEDHTIDETIVKGSTTLKNNYKKWLLSTSSS